MFDENAVWEMVTKEAESIIQREYGDKWTTKPQRTRQSVAENDVCHPSSSLAKDNVSSTNPRLAEQSSDAFLWDDLLTLGNADYRDLISALYDNLPENSPDADETTEEVLSLQSTDMPMIDHRTMTMSENVIKPRIDMDQKDMHSQIIPNSHSAGDVFDFIVSNSSAASSVQPQSISGNTPEPLRTDWDDENFTIKSREKEQCRPNCSEDFAAGEHNVEFEVVEFHTENADVRPMMTPDSISKDSGSLTCCMKPKQFDKLSDHESSKMKLADDQNLFSCNACDYTTRSRTQFWRHRKALNHFTDKFTVSVPLLCCALCNYTTQSRFNITRHVERVHVAERRTSCKHCNALFKDADTLRKHRAYCSRAPAEDISWNACASCARCFKTASDLRRHTRLVHEGARDYICGHCSKRFQTGANMRRHVAADVCGAAQFAAS